MADNRSPEQIAEAEALRQKLASSGMIGGTKLANQITAGVVKDQKLEATITGQGQESKYQYGGWAGGEAEAASRYRNQADAAQNREGVQVNYGMADQSRQMGLGARQGQVNMAGLMAARASGQTPSIAGMMADRQMGQAAAEQSSAAASARGPAALALSQQGAAANTAAMQSNISGQAQINAANERLQAEQAAMGAYTGMRGGDQALQGQDANQAQFQGQLNAQQRGLNDSMTLGMTGFETGVHGAQMSGGQNQVAQQASGAANYQNILNARRAGSDAKDAQMLQAGATVAATGAMMMSDGRTKAPATWGTTKAAPAAPATWGTGPGTDPVDNAAQQAHAALDQQQARDLTPPRGPSGGPMAVEQGIGALKRRNDEELGLIQSKERVGAKLTKKELSMRSVMERRQRLDNGAAEAAKAPGAAPRAAATAREKPTTGEAIGGGLMQMGRVFGSQQAPPPAQMVTPQLLPIAAPTVMSDEKTKLAAAWDAVGSLNNEDEDGGSIPSESKPKIPHKPQSEITPKTLIPTGKAGEPTSTPGSVTTYTKEHAPAPERAAKKDDSPSMLSSMAARMRTMVSDERTKNVGSLGKEVPHSDMADAARSMRAVPYSYKPEYAAREGQAPGEVNVGPVAQEMEKSRVGATIVKPDPQGSGMRTIDQPKMVKALGGIVADQQDQLDELRSLMARRLGGSR